MIINWELSTQFYDPDTVKILVKRAHSLGSILNTP
jgi:hypothetical protein